MLRWLPDARISFSLRFGSILNYCLTNGSARVAVAFRSPCSRPSRSRLPRGSTHTIARFLTTFFSRDATRGGEKTCIPRGFN